VYLLTKVLKSAGAWMTDCGASSELERARVGIIVSSFASCDMFRDALASRGSNTTLPMLPWLDGLVTSSMSGERMSLSSSSLGGFSMDSSSICRA
jgi:hypothetical protein